MKRRDRLLFNRLLFSGVCLYGLMMSQSVLAQIVRDDSTPTDLEECSAECVQITGGTSRGSNLFHSFEEFNVGDNQRVRFVNPDGIENILTRVTGNNPSRIRGRLGVDGGANLFLLNPHGIIFGREARLDVRGSFVATTADRFVFSDGSEFSATRPEAPPLLAVHVPIGLQFGQSPGSIHSQGQLQVDSHRTLALIGGDITLSGGRLGAEIFDTAESRRIEIGSVAAGRVNLRSIPDGFALNYEPVRGFQDIRLSQGAEIDASGNLGGAIQLWGRNIILTDGSFISSETRLERETGSARETGRTLSINAVDSIHLSEGSWIGTKTFDDERNAGDVVIRASNSIVLNPSTQIFSDVCPSPSFCPGSTGNSGNLTLVAQQLLIRSARIEDSTFAMGRGGNIEVRTSDLQITGIVPDEDRAAAGIFAQAALNSTGDTGNINIRTDRLIAQEGGQIATSTFGSGNAGTLTIQAADFIRLNGVVGDFSDPDMNFVESGLFASAEFSATGDAGTVDITTEELTVEDGASISVRNFGRRGGRINIRADSILLDGGEVNEARLNAFTAADSEIGEGVGTINIQDPDLLIMRNGSRISAASITVVNADAGAGNIIINAPNGFIVAASQQDTDIFASAFAGQGGNIDIAARGILGFEVRPFMEGNGTNDIDASSRFGESGTVRISAFNLDPAQGLTELPSTPIQTELVQGCRGEGGVASAEFFNTGRGGIPASPYEPLSESAVLDDVRLPVPPNSPDRADASPATPVDRPVEAEGWVVNDRSQVVLVAEIPTLKLEEHRCSQN